MYRDALKAILPVQGAESLEYAGALANLADLLRDQNKLQEAQRSAEESVRIADHWIGAADPHLGHKLRVLASIYLALGRLDEAQALCERILAVSTGSSNSARADTPPPGMNWERLP
ncbi:MAG: tetratricopeptide repeat protein [Paludibaculum sp.]